MAIIFNNKANKVPLFINSLNIMDTLLKILNTPFIKNTEVTAKTVIIIVIMIIISRFLLNKIRNYLTKKLNSEDTLRFVSFYEYLKYLVYLTVIMVILSFSGVELTGLIAGGAALLLGVGLALQTFFQDIISGLFILVDKSVHVNDIIEVEGKVGRVTHINLRTTKAITIDNRILIIPNHLYLTNSLYNWTQNDDITRESVDVGVAYGSDVKLVKELLTKAALNVDEVIPNPAPMVLFMDFGDNALLFKIVFTIEDSFFATIIKSKVRFEIDRLFRAHNVTIPFPQRDVYVKKV